METENITKSSKAKTIMICCFVTFLLALAISGFSQNPINLPIDTTFIMKKINIQGRFYIYQNEIMTQNKIYDLISKSNVAGIDKNIRTAKKFRILQSVSFTSGVIAASFATNILAYDYIFKEQGFNNKNNQMEHLGTVLFFSGTFLMISTDIFRDYKKKYNKRAIKLYNQQF